LNNFWTLAIKINKIEEEINTEKEVLLWQALKRIEKTILEKRNKRNSSVKKEINTLKKEI
jgi:hypothetical protein